jgi:hypothetical protein
VVDHPPDEKTTAKDIGHGHSNGRSRGTREPARGEAYRRLERRLLPEKATSFQPKPSLGVIMRQVPGSVRATS